MHVQFGGSVPPRNAVCTKGKVSPSDHKITCEYDRWERVSFVLGFFPLNLLLNKKLELILSLCSLFEDYLRAKLKTIFKFYVWWQEDRLNVELMQNS